VLKQLIEAVINTIAEHVSVIEALIEQLGRIVLAALDSDDQTDRLVRLMETATLCAIAVLLVMALA
jgi:hypothetical protein